MLDLDAIRANVAAVEAKIAVACARAGRNRDEVTLVAVTKTFPAIAIDHAVAAGVTNVGENRVQEARDKQPETKAAARWHLIGHLQSNKAKDAVRLFDVIQTIEDAGWCSSCDWQGWEDEGLRYVEEPARVGAADADVLARLLTLHVALERRNEGHLADMAERGHLKVILERLRELRELHGTA